MSDMKRSLGWVFAIWSFVSIIGAVITLAFRIAYGLEWRGAEDIVQCGMLATGVLLGIAGWAVLRGRPSARWWGLAASGAMFGWDLVMMVLAHKWGVKLSTPWLTMLVGLGGLLVFAKPDINQDASPQPKRRPRVAGDGTHVVFEGLLWVGQVVGFVVGMNWWFFWGRRHGLPEHGSIWIDALLGALITTTIHEIGHASVGRALGLKLNAFVAGPLQWRIRGGAWKFSFKPSGLLSAEGATGIDLADPNLSRRSAALMMTAGPAANLVTGALLTWATLVSVDAPWHGMWMVLALTSSWSLVAAVVNLIPARVGGGYSDGANLIQILTGKDWVAIHFGGAMTLLKQGLEAELAGRPVEAEDCFRKILALGAKLDQESQVRALVCLSDALCDQDRLAEAKGYVETALTMGDATGSGQGTMCDLLLAEMSDPERALHLAEEAMQRVTAQPRSREDQTVRAMFLAKYWARKTRALVQLGQLSEARSAVKTAIEVMENARVPRPASGSKAAEMVFGRPSDVFHHLLTAAVSLYIGEALVALDADDQAVNYFAIARDTDPKGKYRIAAIKELEKIGRLVWR